MIFNLPANGTILYKLYFFYYISNGTQQEIVLICLINQFLSKLFVNESLLSFKQHISSKKKHKFEIKSFILSNYRTEFIQDIIDYVGQSTIVNTENKDIWKIGSISTYSLQENKFSYWDRVTTRGPFN